jgi:hypothetical protein
VELIGPYLAASALLVLAGSAKTLAPADTARALGHLVGLPARLLRAAVRAGAIAETGVGLAALIFPRTATAALVAASYGGFAVYVGYARSRGGPLATCGCFGTPDTPATRLHVVLDLGFCASAVAVAVAAPLGSIASILGTQPWRGVPLVLASGAGAWLAVLALSSFAKLHAARGRFRTSAADAA